MQDFNAVVIGTTAPTSNLDVAGIITNTGIATNTNSTNIANNIIRASGGATAQIAFRTAGTISSSAPVWSTGLRPSDSGFKITSYDGTTFLDRIYIDSFGNIGIGTTAPAQLLDVAGIAQVQQLNVQGTNGSIFAAVGIRNSSTTAGTGSRISFANGGGGGTPMAWIGNDLETTTTDSALTFSTRLTSGNPSEKMRISALGNVGIGTTTPINSLTVSGNANVTGGFRSAQPLFTAERSPWREDLIL